MIFLFIASIGLVVYGTMFPFNFSATAHDGGLLDAFLDSASILPSRGDLLSNVVLFLPFGFFGMQALSARLPVFARYALVFALGFGTSVGIECAQFYLPSRTTSFYDLGLNTLSTLIGATGGRLNWQKLVAGGVAGARPRSIFPIFLVAAWLGYRLFPYVPTIDFQHVKDAIKPLIDMSAAAPADIIRHFAMALAVARLSEAIVGPRLAALGFVAAVLGVIAAKPFIMTKIINPAEVIGATAAVLAWFAAVRWLKFRTGLVAIVLVAGIAAQGLVPFELRAVPADFSFVPFGGFEKGSMLLNLQTFMEKVFLYGSLVWLVGQAGGSTPFSLLFAVVYLTAIEVAQTFIAGRTPEITDPLLGLVLGAALLALERHYHQQDRAAVATA